MSLQNSLPKTNSAEDQEDAISIPLYLGGLAVSLLGILAVNSAISDSQLGSTTLMLTVLGFFFSIGCRWLQINPRIVESLVIVLCLYLAFRFVTHTISYEFFIPPDVTQGDLIMAVILSWITVIRSWIMTKDDSVLFTTVTSIAMIGLVGVYDVNGELLLYFFAYMMCATFLLLHQTYLTQRRWCILGAGNSKEKGVLGLQASLSVIAGIVAVLAGTVLVVPLRAVGAHLSLATALKNLVDLEHGADGNSSSDGQQLSLSDDGSFSIGNGSLGSASDKVVITVTPQDHSEHYYRGRTYDTYEGNGWVSSEQNSSFLLTPPFGQSDGAPTTEYFLRTPDQPGGDASEGTSSDSQAAQQLLIRFVLSPGVSTSMLYLPYGTTEIAMHSAPAINVRQSPDNNVSLDSVVEGGYKYGTSSFDPTASPRQLSRATSVTVSCPVFVKTQYIDQRGTDVVSPSDQARLAKTAKMIVQSIPPGRRTDFGVAEAIRQWVSQRCEYSLNVAPVPQGDDSVSYFLFQSRRGYCDLFASSMAILCRYAGIPSRVATGFDPGVQNKDGSFDLRARDKHAWVEVWFNGYGWQIFDPTVGTVEDTSDNSSQKLPHWLTAGLTRLRLFFELHGYLPVLIGICTVLGLAYVYKVEVYDKKLVQGGALGVRQSYRSLAAAQSASAAAAALYSKNEALLRYESFEQMFRAAGFKRERSATPGEFLAGLNVVFTRADGTSFPEAAEVLAAVQTLTDDVLVASYAPIELVAEQLVAAEQAQSGMAALNIVRGRASALRKWRNETGRQKSPTARAT